MKKDKKRIFHIIYGRTFITIVLILIQIYIMFMVFDWLKNGYTHGYTFFNIITVILVIYILNKKEDSSFKLIWIISLLAFPVFGALFYMFIEFQIGNKIINEKLSNIIEETNKYLSQSRKIINKLKDENKEVANLAKYIFNVSKYPVYKNSTIKYYPLGEEQFNDMKVELKKAKKFIFMEYFIIEKGVMWDSILEILEKKAEEGVEIRVMYDGVCSLALLPYNYPKKLIKKGIKCKMFSPVKPALLASQNNRDHRKILVIDGNIAFTGGVNIGDEYINLYKKFGHWKDVAIKITGDSVKSFTLMFLQMWNINEKKHDDFLNYISIKNREKSKSSSGYVIPYGDSPLDNETVGENVYLDILNTAKKYVHIMTPYLIIDNKMICALTYAAKRGIDVKIILPNKPDKISAFMLAKTYYKELLQAGVRIYEYIPGFIHAKIFSSDNEKAVIGSINLDFRSLYLHFECATYIYKNNVVNIIEKDFEETLSKCKRITIDEYKKLGLLFKIGGKLLRLIAPLM